MDERKAQEIAARIATATKPVLLVGPPGSGRTMIARRVVEHLRPDQRLFEAQKIRQALGLPVETAATPPFRAPHHTVSRAGMIGQAPDSCAIPRFGEVSLAHGGVLFLDELPEFAQAVLDAVSKAYRDGQVWHRLPRDSGMIAYPGSFRLVAAMNPCPCGWGVGSGRKCRCTSDQVRAYKLRAEPIKKLCVEIDLREVE